MATKHGRKKADPKADPWMSLAAAARELGESRLKTMSRVLDRQLEAQKVAGRTVVSRRSVEMLLAASGL